MRQLVESNSPVILTQTVDTTTTNYTLDLNNGLTQVLTDGTDTYLYGLGRIGEFDGTDWTYPLADALGSVRQLTDASGAPVMAQNYAPYGDVLESYGAESSNYGYAGEWTDGTGLQYLRARYLNTGIGRFISRDTWGGDYNRPLSLNRWGYVEGNPVRYTDPSGHICLDPWAPAGYHLDLDRDCEYPEGSTGAFWWRRDPLGDDTAIIDMPWVDEMAPEMWNQYPNSCGAAALYMFLMGEGVAVNFDTLVQQLRSERPGGYDGYCCSSGWDTFPTPTPDPGGWCNEACASAETLAEVARKYYSLNVVSGDNWTHTGVYQKVSQGHPVLTLIRSEVTTSTNYFGHFVVIKGFIDRGWTVVFNDSYPGEAYWNVSADVRRGIGESREADWDDFDASWASSVDPMDPLSPGGHIRWAMAVK